MDAPEGNGPESGDLRSVVCESIIDGVLVTVEVGEEYSRVVASEGNNTGDVVSETTTTSSNDISTSEVTQETDSIEATSAEILCEEVPMEIHVNVMEDASPQELQVSEEASLETDTAMETAVDGAEAIPLDSSKGAGKIMRTSEGSLHMDMEASLKTEKSETLTDSLQTETTAEILKDGSTSISDDTSTQETMVEQTKVEVEVAEDESAALIVVNQEDGIEGTSVSEEANNDAEETGSIRKDVRDADNYNTVPETELDKSGNNHTKSVEESKTTDMSAEGKDMLHDGKDMSHDGKDSNIVKTEDEGVSDSEIQPADGENNHTGTNTAGTLERLPPFGIDDGAVSVVNVQVKGAGETLPVGTGEMGVESTAVPVDGVNQDDQVGSGDLQSYCDDSIIISQPKKK